LLIVLDSHLAKVCGEALRDALVAIIDRDWHAAAVGMVGVMELLIVSAAHLAMMRGESRRDALLVIISRDWHAAAVDMVGVTELLIVSAVHLAMMPSESCRDAARPPPVMVQVPGTMGCEFEQIPEVVHMQGVEAEELDEAIDASMAMGNVVTYHVDVEIPPSSP
ncbi:hypothetical protein GGF32_008274, partial [Allomyces javanicus]